MVKTRLRECDALRGARFPSPSGMLTHLSLYLSAGYCTEMGKKVGPRLSYISPISEAGRQAQAMCIMLMKRVVGT